MKHALFLGRWQPLTNAHEWLIRKKLDQGIPCLILVRDIPPDERNPFTTQETIEMIKAAFKDEAVLVEAVCSSQPNIDIESVNFGRKVGYEINDHGECPVKGISATAVRKSIKEKDGLWKTFVSSKVAEWLENYFKE